MRALATAGAPAMLYGACAARPGAAALRGARRTTLHVALRARRRAAPEALGCLTGIRGRADPAAVVAVAPWEALWRLHRAWAAPIDRIADALAGPTALRG